MDTTLLDAGLARSAARSVCETNDLRLRSISMAQAQLARRVGSGLSAQFAACHGAVRLEVSAPPLTRSAGSSRPMLLQTPAGPLAVLPARDVVRALTAIDLPDDPEGDSLHALRMDVAVRSMPAGWLAAFGASMTWTASAQDPDAPVDEPLELTLSIAQPQAGLGLAGTLRGSLEALLYALSQPAWQRLDDARNVVLSDLPLQVPVRLGTTTLALSTVKALGPGDMVPLKRPLFNLAGEGEVRIANGLAKVVLQLGNQSVVELTEWHPTTLGQTMNNMRDFLPDSDADAALDELPVTLTFNLGAIEVTLAQLKALGPGSVLPLVGAAPPQVTVCVGARRLGIGELVELEGQLAIEIRRMGAVS